MATSKKIHTHRGTCQACGGLQAVDNNTQHVAKHGYVVAGFGFFNGVCSGAGRLPAEKDTAHTHAIIASLIVYAERAAAYAVALTNRTEVLTTYEETHWDNTTRKNVTVTKPLADAPAYIVNREYSYAISQSEGQARRALQHVEFLRANVLPRLGKPLAKVARKAAPRKFKSGDTVKIISGPDRALIDVVLTSEVHGGFSRAVVRGYRYTVDGVPNKFWVSLYDLRKLNK